MADSGRSVVFECKIEHHDRDKNDPHYPTMVCQITTDDVDSLDAHRVEILVGDDTVLTLTVPIFLGIKVIGDHFIRECSVMEKAHQ